MADLRIEGVELTLYLSDGGMINVDVSPTMLRAIIQSTGLLIRDVNTENGQTYYSMCRMSDKDIEEKILPRLPSWK